MKKYRYFPNFARSASTNERIASFLNERDPKRCPICGGELSVDYWEGEYWFPRGLPSHLTAGATYKCESCNISFDAEVKFDLVLSSVKFDTENVWFGHERLFKH